MPLALTPSSFPQLPQSVRAFWAPVYLSPILGSPERLVIAVAAVDNNGFHVEAANALRHLSCLYGRAAETLFAADVALDELRGALAERGPSALKSGYLVFSGVSIGEVSEGEARTLSALARTWMSALSSLYIYQPDAAYEEAPEAADDPGVAADRLPILVLEHVVSFDPTFSRFFSERIREHRQRRLSAKVAGIDIDFSGVRFVANFSTLQAGTLAYGVDRVKRKMFDLKGTHPVSTAA